MLLVLLLGYAWNVYRVVLLKAGSSCVSITMHAEELVLQLRDGSEIQGVLASSSLVTAWLTVLHVDCANLLHGRSVVIFPDSLDDERFRELRVLLKWH